MPITIDGTWSPNKSGAICEIVDVILQYNGHAQCTQFVIVQWPIAHLAPWAQLLRTKPERGKDRKRTPGPITWPGSDGRDKDKKT